MKTVYLVKQFQEDSDYWNTTIGVYDSREGAEVYRDSLNKEYFMEGVHWYEVEAIPLFTSL